MTYLLILILHTSAGYEQMREPLSEEQIEAQIVAVANVLLAWEAEISNRVSARVLAEDVLRAALAARETK